MADRCHIKDCPDSPRYHSSCDERLKICENHKFHHPSPNHYLTLIDFVKERIQSDSQEKSESFLGLVIKS